MTDPSVAVTKAQARYSYQICGAKKRQGTGVCTQKAGWGTDHPGSGRCKLHGGAAPVKHGRYSKVLRKRVGELAAQFEADPDPLNLEPELAQARALYADYLERMEGKPGFDPGGAAKLLAEISKAAKRMRDSQAANAVSRAELFRVLGEMGRGVDMSVAELVQDLELRDELLKRIHDLWTSIRL